MRKACRSLLAEVCLHIKAPAEAIQAWKMLSYGVLQSLSESCRAFDCSGRYKSFRGLSGDVCHRLSMARSFTTRSSRRNDENEKM